MQARSSDTLETVATTLPSCSQTMRNLSSRYLLSMTCLLWMVSACTTPPAKLDHEKSVTTFVIVRHAEKATDDARDPSLSQAGHDRAQALARLLADAPVSATYATRYRRTQQTAAPTASAQRISVSTYEAALPALQFATQLRETHAHGGTVLVVGHSNTVPDIAAALSGQYTDAMPESEFDRLYRIRIDADGKASLVTERYP